MHALRLSFAIAVCLMLTGCPPKTTHTLLNASSERICVVSIKNATVCIDPMHAADLVDGEFWFDRSGADGGGIEMLNIEGRTKTCHLLTIPHDERVDSRYRDRPLVQMNLIYVDRGDIYLAPPDVRFDELKSQLRRSTDLPRLERCNAPDEARPEVLEGHPL